jgi:hypothetical protein
MVQSAYSGAITRYYGEEIGDEVPDFADKVSGDCAAAGLCDDHVARSSAKIPGVSVAAESLSGEQRALLEFHRQAMAARAAYPALSRGDRQHLYSDATLYVDLKSHGSQQIVFAMNTGTTARDLRLDGDLFAAMPQQAWDILGEEAITASDGDLAFSLAPLSGRYILLDDAPLAPVPVNYAMTDAWYDRATNGQGFMITVYPQRELLFLSWFTYDAERPPADTPFVLGEPGHRWLTAQGFISGNRALLNVTRTAGGVFDAALPATANAAGGWIELEFESCRAARLLYRIEPAGLEGEIQLSRITDAKLALCEALTVD